MALAPKTESKIVLITMIRKAPHYVILKCGHLFTSALLAMAVGLTTAHGAEITVLDESAGPTPKVLAYNLAHFQPGSNTADWWRYARVSGARMFMSPAHFNVSGTSRPGEAWVGTEEAFLARREALRADPLNTNYINWPVVEGRFDVNLTGNNRILPRHAYEQIHRRGGAAMAQMTLSHGAFPIENENDWVGKWVAWRTFYSLVFFLAREYDVERFTVYNEPNHPNSFIEPDPWLMRARLASDATRSAIADVNRIYGKSLRPLFTAPVTAGAGGNAYNEYGRPAARSFQTDFLGRTNGFNRLFELYAYQQYNQTPAGFANQFNNLRNLVFDDLPGGVDPLPRFAITEYNVHTGATYDGMPETPDTLAKAVRFAAITTSLMQDGVDEFYAFKFGMTGYPSTRNFPVQKNGMLYTDNDNAPHNYGTMTRSAEAYRLFNKAFAPGRERLARDVTGPGAGDLWLQVSRDADAGMVWVYSVNDTGGAIPFDLDLTALDIPDGNHVIIEDVSQWRNGVLRSMERVENGRVLPGNQPAQTVWLISIPTRPQKPVTEDSNILEIPVTADAMVRDGTHANTNFGSEGEAWARNDASDPSGRAAALLRFELPEDWDPSELQIALLAVPVSPINGGSETVHAHLYGIDNPDWDESTVTWTNAPNLRKNAATGNEIRHGVVTGAGETAHILGQLTVSGSGHTTRRVDVTDYLIRKTGGAAGFLITQDPRWDIDIHQPEVPAQWSDLPRGDTQPDGMRVRTREGTEGTQQPATLILIRGPKQPVEFGSWIQRHFPGVTDPAVIGPKASPAADGIPNLVKFALGLSPLEPGLNRLPAAGRDENGDAFLPFPSNRLATGIEVDVEWSQDLQSWTSDGLLITQEDESEETRWQTARLASEGARIFFRMRVSQN